MTGSRPPHEVRQVCVVGAGPRGLSVVERLCANAAESGSPLVVHLVDPYVGRGGRVWHTGQPTSLLMNTIASQVSMFTDDTVDCAGPVAPGPSLHEWATGLDPADGHPAWVLAEAAALGPNSYPTRAFYGHYLDWVLLRLRRAYAPTVSIEAHRQTAVSVEDTEPGDRDSPQVVTLGDQRTLTGLSAVVLAQGHVDMPLEEEERGLVEFADERGLRYWPPANPAEVDLRSIAPDEPVALRGMGLAFFDHLALLTVDRGGRFVAGGPNGLTYLPSGREPRIVAGSRRGVPYHARGENEKGAFGRHEPVFLTEAVIAGLRARAEAGGPVTFRADVWPLISREVELVYYTTLLRHRDGSDVAAEFVDRFVADQPDLPSHYGVPPEDRWNWELVAYPHAGRRFGSPEEFHSWLLALLREDVRHADLGNVTDPLKAALDVLRDLRNEIRLAVDHSGLTGTSYRTELDAWYTPLNAYLSIGPPAHRVAELIALVEAGVVRVVGPRMRVDTGERGFLISSPAVSGSPVITTSLVEARLPGMDIRRTTDPLLSRLREDGGCGPYRMPDPAGAVETGGLNVTRRPYHVIDARSAAHPRRFGYGVPTESVHWVTAAGIRPGVNSVILADADAIARAALAATAPASMAAVAQPA